MTGFKILLYASVLYPAYLRDLLLHFAEKGFYDVRWTDQILLEASRNIKKRQPEDVHDKVDRMIARLNEAFEEASVTGYEDLIPVMRNHPKDRHVLAAAVTDNVNMIIANNVKDFPREACDRYKIEVMGPDEYLTCQWSLVPSSVFCTLLEDLVDSYSRPAFTLSSAAAEPWRKVVPKFSESVLSYVGR